MSKPFAIVDRVHVAAYEERRQRDQTKLEQMVVHAQTALCRTHVLREALGETMECPQCGSCDNCSGSSGSCEAVAAGSCMMDHASDPVSRLKLRDSSLAPLAMLGALAVTVGVTAYLAWPARRSASTRQRQALIAYLRDHLTASDVPFVSCIVSVGSTRVPRMGRCSVDCTKRSKRTARSFEHCCPS